MTNERLLPCENEIAINIAPNNKPLDKKIEEPIITDNEVDEKSGLVRRPTAETLRKYGLITPPRHFVRPGAKEWLPAYYYKEKFYFIVDESVYIVKQSVTCDNTEWTKSWTEKMKRSSIANSYFMTFQLATFENLKDRIKVTSTDKLNVLVLLCQALINAIFILSNFAFINEYESSFYRNLFIIVVVAEGLLWLIHFIRFAYNVYSLTKRYFTKDETHYQTKNVAVHLNSIATVSILRYVPCGEMMVLLMTRFREIIAQKNSYYDYQVKNAQTFSRFVIQLRIACELLMEPLGPILGIISLLLKLSLLKFATNKLFYQWSFFQFLKFLGFLNQITGMREINQIEIQTIEHFVFSNKNCELKEDDQDIIQDYWNVVLVTAVAASENCRLKSLSCIWNSVAYWSSMTREKMETLLKHQNIDLADLKKKKIHEFADEIRIDYDRVSETCSQHFHRSRISL